MAILVIFDYDRTLADADGPFGEWNIFRTKTMENIQEATAIYEKHRRGPDDIVEFQKLLEKFSIIDPMQFFLEANMNKQLFDDTLSSLIELQEYDDVFTVILTTWNESLQHIKTHLTWITNHVDEVYITRDRNKIEHIQNIYKKYQPDYTFFIDDSIHMDQQDFDFPIQIIEMNRPGLWMKEYSVRELRPVLEQIRKKRIEFERR